jgi:hypothetical protein
MSAPRDLFVELFTHRPMLHPGDREVVEILRNAADQWRADGRFFSAAICMSTAIYGAWGDGAEFDRCLVQAAQDYQACVDTQLPNSLESLAALRKWSGLLMYVERTAASHLQRVLQQELAERLMRFFSEGTQRDSYLVKGFVLITDLDGHWEVTCPDHEVSAGWETSASGQISIGMPSAFRLLIALGDFAGAHKIATRCPDAFTKPGLRGWRFAIQGFLSPKDAVQPFALAADAFAEDVEPSSEEEIREVGYWDAANITLWAKYFRARAVVARILREPSRAEQLLTEASNFLKGTDSGFVHAQVWRFRLLVDALLQLIQGGEVDVDRTRKDLLGAQRLLGPSNDDLIIEQFVESATRAFESLRTDPARALIGSELHIALQTLAQIPLLGAEVAIAISPAIGGKAYKEILGPHRTWIHLTLAAIEDEGQLRKIVLRLAQAELPRYAHIRHGPLEYGKDVVAVFEIGGRVVLRMWQAKIGDITVQRWRESRNELEEMYQVPLASFQIGVEVDEREGILICNAHANPHVEPVMAGWFAEQERDHHRQFQFMHLDTLVNWIIDNRLINEFRAVLDELGIQPTVGKL